MDNKLHYAQTFFCSHLAAVGRASEVQAADKRWQAEKPLTREAYERLSSIYYESFIDSLMQVDGQTSGAVYADTAHLTLETDRLCTLRHPKLPAAEYAFRLCRFHLFFFPYDICLFAMEIAEEPETTLDTLIAAHGILEATATTAVAMTEQQAKSLHEKLEKLTGKTIDLKTKVDPAVLGGIRLDIEGTELDGTVQNRLSALRRDIASVTL